MIVRSFATVCCAVFLFAVAFAPVDATARSGGLTVQGGRHIGGGVAPAGPRPALHTGKVTKFLGATPVKAVHLHKHDHVAPIRRFKRFFGPRFPLSGVVVFYGPTYDPVLYDTAVPIPMNGAAPGEEDSGRGCRSHTIVVPSESGGERQVTVTQCNQR
jgi:hypothetical protein